MDDILSEVYRQIIDNGNPVSEVQKGPNKEILAVTLELTNPVARLSRSESKGKIFSCIGEWLWYMSGSDQLDQIQYYISIYDQFSDDKQSIAGAYGPRIFNTSNAEPAQFDKLLDMLKNKPNTRKAVIQIFLPSDTQRKSLDTPCTLSLQFFIRKNRLFLITHMRSNDAYKGLPHDLFAFTMIQEYLARLLGKELGSYTHVANSLHLYEKDFDNAKTYINEGFHSTKPVMNSMPSENAKEELEKLLRDEKKIRLSKTGDISIEDYFNPYWQDLATLLIAYKVKDDNARLENVLKSLKNNNYMPYIQKRIEYKRLQTATQLQLPSTNYHDHFLRLCIAQDKIIQNHSGLLVSEAMPVPFFGNINTARIATLGINPSKSEFFDRNNKLLTNQEKRLIDRSSLKIKLWRKASSKDVGELNESCTNYFHNNPYNAWFKKLESLVISLKSSFYDKESNVCHLDLVPFTTCQKWNDVTSKDKERLLSASKDFFIWQLFNSDIEFVILNGASVVKYFEKALSINLDKIYESTINLYQNNGKIVKGYYISQAIDLDFNGTQKKFYIFGYNHNLQSSFGISNSIIKNLCSLLSMEYKNAYK